MAIWTHGGVRGGSFNQGQPNITRLVKELSENFIVDVFTVGPARETPEDNFKIYSAPVFLRFAIFKWLWLLGKFLIVATRRRYAVHYAFWGYPSGVVAFFLAVVSGSRSVIHLQGGDAVYVPKIRYGVFGSALRHRLCRFIYKRCDLLIALTRAQASNLPQWGIERAPLIIPYPADESLFRYTAREPLLTPYRFLIAGNATPVKDQLAALRIFAEVLHQVPAHLTIVGGDFYGGALQRWCADNGIEQNVSFKAMVPHQEMAEYYHTSDVLLHTSLFEGQALVVAEAAMCGTIVAGTATGLIADMGENCCIILNTTSAQNSSSRILEVISDPAMVATLRESALSYAKTMGVNATSHGITAAINSLVSRDSLP